MKIWSQNLWVHTYNEQTIPGSVPVDVENVTEISAISNVQTVWVF